MIDWRKAIKMRKLFFVFFFFNIHFHLFTYLAVPGLIFIFIAAYSSCIMWDPVLWPGSNPGPPALQAWSLNHWTTREVPKWRNFFGEFGDSVHEQGFPGGDNGKEHTCQCRRCKNPRFNPEPGKSPGGGHGNPLQYSCLENPMDSGALAVYSPLACKESDTIEVT